MIAVKCPEHVRPRLRHHKQTALIVTETFPCFRLNVRHDSRQRLRAASRFGRRHARQRAEHDAAGFGLPPGVDDRTLLATNHFVIPHPRFRIDRFSDRSKKTQTRQVVLVRPLVAPFDECSNRRRSRVENVDLILFDHLPEAAFVRPVRTAFVHDSRRPVRQRSVNDVAVPGDPANVGGTPVRVFVFQIEDPA